LGVGSKTQSDQIGDEGASGSVNAGSEARDDSQDVQGSDKDGTESNSQESPTRINDSFIAVDEHSAGAGVPKPSADESADEERRTEVHDDSPKPGCTEIVLTLLWVCWIFIGGVLLIALLVSHLALDLVHQVTGKIGDCCFTIPNVEAVARPGDRAAERYVAESGQCKWVLDCVFYAIGFAINLASYVLWSTSWFLLQVAQFVNESLFNMEWLEDYNESYDGATLPTCDCGETTVIEYYSP
jgi:hypothetical protein